MASSLLVGGVEAVFGGDGEGAECCFRSAHPAFPSSPGRVETTHNEVETLQGTLLGGEIAPGSGRSAHPGVERLHGVRIGHEMGGTLDARTGSGSGVRDSSGCCGGTARAGRSTR